MDGVQITRCASGTVLVEMEEATVAVDVPVAMGRSRRLADASGEVNWADVDVLCVSSVRGFRGVPFATEHAGYRGRVFVSDPVLDGGRWEMLGLLAAPADGEDRVRQCYSRADVDACLSKVERVEAHRHVDLGGWYLLPLPSTGCVGGMAWLLQSPAGKSVLIANAGALLDPPASLGAVDVVVSTELDATAVCDHAKLAEMVQYEVEGQQRHVVLPAYLNADPFGALRLSQYLADNTRVPCVVVSAKKEELQELAGRVYEFLPPSQQKRLVLPERPFFKSNGAPLPALSTLEMQHASHASSPTAFVFADYGALDLPRLAPDMLLRIQHRATFATGLTIIAPCRIPQLTPGAQYKEGPYSTRLAPAALDTICTAVQARVVVANSEAQLAAGGGAARYEVKSVPPGGSTTVDADADTSPAGPPAKRRRVYEGVIDVEHGDVARRGRAFDKQLVWPLGTVKVRACDGHLTLRPTNVAPELYGSLSPDLLAENLRTRQVDMEGFDVQWRGAGSWEAVIPSINAKVASDAGETRVACTGSQRALQMLDRAIEQSLFAV